MKATYTSHCAAKDQVALLEFDSNSPLNSVGNEAQGDCLQALYETLQKAREELLKENESIDFETTLKFKKNVIQSMHDILDKAEQGHWTLFALREGGEELSKAWSQHYQEMIESRKASREWAESEIDWQVAFNLLEDHSAFRKICQSLILRSEERR